MRSNKPEQPRKVDCRQAAHDLYDYLDGELTEDRRSRIAEHLDKCGHCSDAALFESELRQVIADRCRDHVPESLRERIATALAQEQSCDRGHGPRSGSGLDGPGAS